MMLHVRRMRFWVLLGASGLAALRSLRLVEPATLLR